MCDCGHHSSNSLSQTLDELEFERGIWSAAQSGDYQRVLELLDKGWDVDRRDTAGYTALHYAARNGHLDVCKLLLDRGANIDAVTCHGKATPLHRASAAGKSDIVKYLIEKRANYSLRDVDGKNVLHRAAEGQHYDICRFLLTMDRNLRDALDGRNKQPIDYVYTDEFRSLFM